MRKDPESLTGKDVVGTEQQPLITSASMETSTSYTSTSRTSIDDSRSDSSRDDGTKTDSVWTDSKDTFMLGIPIFLSMLSWVAMKTTDTSLLGHVSREALAASSLSDLWTMCTAVLLQGRVLSVLCGAAIGAGNPKLAGIYLQVSYYVLAWIVVVVFIAWHLTEPIWVWLGSDPLLAKMAGYYAKVLAWSLPGQMIYGQLAQFFSSQRIMHPEVNAASIAMIANLLFGVVFVLGVPFLNFDGYGFPACPIVTSFMVYLQLFIVTYFYIYKQRLHEPCWDGFNYIEITWERIWTFCDLYFPAALSTASDFWRVAVIGTMAAKLGETEVAVFNASYRIMWIVLIMVSALSSAASIKMTLRLGSMNYIGAKQAGEVGIVMSFIVCFIVSVFVLLKVRWFGRIFTNDPVFIDLFEQGKWPFTITLALMNLSVAIERIPYSMGRTKEIFWFGLVASWAGQVPAVAFLTKYWRNDIVGLYSGMAVGYLILVVLYSYIIISSDWKKYAELAQTRSEMNTNTQVKE